MRLEARIPGSSSASRCPVRPPFVGMMSSLKVCDFKGLNSSFFYRFSYVLGGLVIDLGGHTSEIQVCLLPG